MWSLTSIKADKLVYKSSTIGSKVKKYSKQTDSVLNNLKATSTLRLESDYIHVHRPPRLQEKPSFDNFDIFISNFMRVYARKKARL